MSAVRKPDWEANTVQMREWLNGGAVSTPSLIAEFKLWADWFSDPISSEEATA